MGFTFKVVNYVNTVQKSPPSGASYNNDYGNGSGESVYARLFYLPRNFNLNGYPYTNPVTGGNTFYRALDNPRWLVENNQYTSDVNRVFANLTLSYDLTDWLTLMARGVLTIPTNNLILERRVAMHLTPVVTVSG